jgi:hypothetical protein
MDAVKFKLLSFFGNVSLNRQTAEFNILTLGLVAHSGER